MRLSCWRRIVALCSLGLFVVPAVSWSQGNPDPQIIDGAKKEGQLVYYTTMTLDQSRVCRSLRKEIPFPESHIVSHRRRAAVEQNLCRIARRQA
jgi:hypothetical protein